MNAKKRYAEKVEVVKGIWLHRIKDADILAKLETVPSISNYIKTLIRKDIEKEG